ncbi:MAG: hypothetical protein AAB706_00840 [Patescibacteria group bacterium]
MKLKYPITFALVTIYLLVGFIFGVLPNLAGANPSQILESKTATATTTTTNMTAGTATTTLTFDTQNDASFPADSATLMIQLTSSTTASILAEIQYSQDNIDWYQSSLSERATTTPSQSIMAQQFFTFNWATSTVDKTADGGAGIAAASSTAKRIVDVKTPTRYVRAIFTMPTGSNLSTLWAQFVAKKQNR